MPTTHAQPPRGRDAVVRVLLDAAAGEFARRGPAASLRDIAAAAGVGLRLVHRHFGSKQGLLDAVLDDLEPDASAGGGAPATPIAALFTPTDRQRLRIRIRAWLDLTGAATGVDPTIVALTASAGSRARRDGVVGAVALAYGWAIFGAQLSRAFGFDARRAAQLPARLAVLADRLATDDLPVGLTSGSTTGLTSGPTTGPTTGLTSGPTTELTTEPTSGPSRRAAGPADGRRRAPFVPGDAPGPGDRRAVGGAREPAPRGADAVRAAIVAAATDRFAAEGIDASLRAIAADAGVNLGLIHRHFGNKDDLVAAVLRTRQGPAVARIARATSLAEALDALTATSVSRGQYSRILAFILLSGLPAARFQDTYPAIATMRGLTTSEAEEDGLLAGLALGHGLTTFGTTLARSAATAPAAPAEVTARELPGRDWLAAARRALVAAG